MCRGPSTRCPSYHEICTIVSLFAEQADRAQIFSLCNVFCYVLFLIALPVLNEKARSNQTQQRLRTPWLCISLAIPSPASCVERDREPSAAGEDPLLFVYASQFGGLPPPTAKSVYPPRLYTAIHSPFDTGHNHILGPRSYSTQSTQTAPQPGTSLVRICPVAAGTTPSPARSS